MADLTVNVDIINENTSAAGVTVDGVLIKDSAVTGLTAVTVYTADGAVAVTNGLHVISKTSAAAMTIAAPTAAQNGLVLTITAGTAYAHVITGNNLLHNGVTGGAKDKITLGAFLGASATLVAYNLLWHVVSLNVAPVTAN